MCMPKHFDRAQTNIQGYTYVHKCKAVAGGVQGAITDTGTHEPQYTLNSLFSSSLIVQHSLVKMHLICIVFKWFTWR